MINKAFAGQAEEVLGDLHEAIWQDMDALIAQLTTRVALSKGPEEHDNGKFAWVVDPDGRSAEREPRGRTPELRVH